MEKLPHTEDYVRLCCCLFVCVCVKAFSPESFDFPNVPGSLPIDPDF